jgi:hypothetical protein
VSDFSHKHEAQTQDLQYKIMADAKMNGLEASAATETSRKSLD